MTNEITMESLIKNWYGWPLDAIPLDKYVVAIWKSAYGEWKSGKFHGHEFYRIRDEEPFNEIPVKWIFYNPNLNLKNR